ncbi:MAG: cyclic nucleotide-binding domain-containing protein [Candidatus Binatia bacterium]
MDDPIHQLRGVSVFGALEEETLDFLLARAVRVAVPAGDLLVRDKDPGGDLYILESGSAEVFKERGGPKPVRAHLADLGPGDCFGETSILACMPRSASIVARTDCTALRLRTTDLLSLRDHDVEQFAILMMNLGRETARRLWEANERLLDRLLE